MLSLNLEVAEAMAEAADYFCTSKSEYAGLGQVGRQLEQVVIAQRREALATNQSRRTSGSAHGRVLS